MRKPIPVYIYHHQEYVARANSIKDAFHMTGVAQPTVRAILNGKCPCSRDGWVFALEELTPEEIEHMPDAWGERIPTKHMAGGGCKKEIENQSYDVDCKDEKVFQLPRNKEGRKAMLRNIIWTKLRERWLLLPNRVATLEKQCIRELIDSL